MRFDHFEFDPETDRLGEGPLSEVYRATDTRLGRTVALKILRAHAEIDPAADTRFQREAQHASNLTHPNIATIYEYGEAANTAFIAMEYLEGQTLDRILKDRTPGIEECLRIAVKVCSALAQVHRAGLIHRDLKPGNIMVLHDGDTTMSPRHRRDRHRRAARDVLDGRPRLRLSGRLGDRSPPDVRLPPHEDAPRRFLRRVLL